MTEKLMEEAFRSQRLIEDALGVVPFGGRGRSTATQGLAKLIENSGRASDVVRQARDRGVFPQSLTGTELASVTANRMAHAQLRGALSIGMGAWRENSAFGARITETVEAISRGLHLGRNDALQSTTARELQAISASMRDAVLGINRAFPGGYPGQAVREAYDTLGMSEAIRELTRPIGARIADLALADLRARRERDWLREAVADQEFWRETHEQIAGLTAEDEQLGERIVAIVRRITAQLWRNTKARTGKLDLYDVFALFLDLLALAAFIAAFTPDEPAPADPQLVEASRSLQTAIDKLGELLQADDSGLSGAPQAEVRSPAWVRSGPSTEFAKRTKLPQGAIVAIRKIESQWRLVIYRDPLTDELEEGWIAARLLSEWKEGAI